MTQVLSPSIHRNLTREQLVKWALKRNEGALSDTGAVSVTTGTRTGRSPADRFIVRDSETVDTIAWGKINQPLEEAAFDKLWQRAIDFLADKECFESDLTVGADDAYGFSVKVITELAWHNLFLHHLFIRDNKTAVEPSRKWTLLSVPGLITDPSRDGVNSDGAVIISMQQRRVLLVGMRYAGEMKKAMFSVLNFFLPEKDVLPMHCAANVGEQGDVALFFGLSGTGKTTLSADPERYLIGDDEHGWSPHGVFNFEGGCYAKCIDLSQEREPVIWHAIRDGAIMENVILNSDNVANYSDATLTQNTRAAYPRDHIEKCVPSNQAGHPQAVIFLTCDLYGVLPPVSLLTHEQAAYHFLSGYTALVGSTEMGGEPGVKPTFSTCFGAPFFPRPPQVYANLLMKRLRETQSPVYLINTGWTGGGYHTGGKRFAIPVTRSIVRAALSGDLLHQPTEVIAGFNLNVPLQVAGVDSQLLNPGRNWHDQQAFKDNLNRLIVEFQQNFKKFAVEDVIKNAGPNAL